jgi:Cofilin/tropomyosin-type actin-binding protein
MGVGATASTGARVDLTDPALEQAKGRVLDRNDEADWALFQYVGQTEKLTCVECDSGGFEEMFEYLSSGKPAFALVSFPLNKDEVPKLVYFTWNPAGVPPMQKGTFHGRSSDVGAWLSPFHLQIDAQNDEDCDVDHIRGKLASASGK